MCVRPHTGILQIPLLVLFGDLTGVKHIITLLFLVMLPLMSGAVLLVVWGKSCSYLFIYFLILWSEP